MLTYVQRVIERRVFSLIDMPLVAVWTGKYLSIYMALRYFARDLVTWYPCLRAWYLGSTTQCVRNHSLLTRLIYNFDWRIDEFFLSARLALIQSGLCREVFQWFMI